jgi:ABC-type branched-subunit amino acid transport system substrate-binding protein
MRTSTQLRRAARAATYGIAGMALAGLSLSACSSAGSTSSSGGGTSSAAQSTILVGGMAPISSQLISLPQARAAQQAAIDQINASGGIDGHPLKLDFCDTKYQASGELDCVRQVISDGVVAMLNPNISADTGVPEYDAAQDAGLPMVGVSGYVPDDMTSSVAFPLASGAPGLVYGAIANLVSHGEKKIAILASDNPTAAYFSSVATQALKLAGLKAVSTVTANPDVDPTFASAAAKVITGGVDGVFIASDPSDIVKMVPALRSQGYKGLVSSISVSLIAQTLKAMGSSADGVLVTGQEAFTTDTANPGIAQFLADMNKYAKGETIDENALLAWSAVELYAKVAIAAHATTRAATLKAFSTLSSPDDIGAIPPYKVAGQAAVLGTYPRMFNPTVQQGSVVDGQLKVFSGGSSDPFTALADAAKS